MCYNIAYSLPIRKGQLMPLAFTIIIALVLVVLALVGYIRDLRRGLVALIGTLAGASLVSFWAAPWAQGLAGSFIGGDTQRLIFIVSCALLLWSGAGATSSGPTSGPWRRTARTPTIAWPPSCGWGRRRFLPCVSIGCPGKRRISTPPRVPTPRSSRGCSPTR
jgi:hypothetical protein